MRTLPRIAVVLSVLGAGGCFKADIKVAIPDGGGATPTQLPGAGGWRGTLWGTLGQTLGAQHGYLYYAFDSLAYPREPVELAIRLQTSSGLKGVKGVTIGFFKRSAFLGEAETNSDGLARFRWTPPAEGDYTFEAKVIEVPDRDTRNALKLTPAPLRVAARSKETEFVVIDLDHTVVDSSFFRAMFGRARPMVDSVRVTRKIAGRYSIIYLTHRPDLLTRTSKSWLTAHRYPFGPLMVSQLKDAFGDSGKFKTGKLKSIRRSFPRVKIGIGDKISDAQAYVDNGLVAYLIPHYKKDKPKDLRKMARKIEKTRGRGRLQVVSGWVEIERGIFGKAKYTPADFADGLKRRAALLEEQERERKRRKKKDDDDDDDDDD